MNNFSSCVSTIELWFSSHKTYDAIIVRFYSGVYIFAVKRNPNVERLSNNWDSEFGCRANMDAQCPCASGLGLRLRKRHPLPILILHTVCCWFDLLYGLLPISIVLLLYVWSDTFGPHPGSLYNHNAIHSPDTECHVVVWPSKDIKYYSTHTRFAYHARTVWIGPIRHGDLTSGFTPDGLHAACSGGNLGKANGTPGLHDF